MPRPGPHLLSLHDDRLRQRVVAALLVGEVLQIIQLCLQLENEILLFFPLGLQSLPLLPLTLTGEAHTMMLIVDHGNIAATGWWQCEIFATDTNINNYDTYIVTLIEC